MTDPTRPLPTTSRKANFWFWTSALGLTGFTVLAGDWPGWGLEPYRATPWMARVALVLAAGFAAAWMWTRRPAAARVVAFLARPVHPAILLPVLWGLFVLLRERRYIGDWINIGFALPIQPEWFLTDSIIWRAPLTNLLLYAHWRWTLAPLAPSDTLFAWQVVFSFYGVLLAVALWGTAREIGGGRRYAALAVLFTLTSGLLLFCLGHVENYIVPMALMAGVAWTAMRSIRRRTGAEWAFLVYGAAFMSHPQCLIFLPAMGIPFAMARRKRGWILHAFRCAVALFVMPVGLAALALATGVGIDPKATAGGEAYTTLLPAAEALSAARFHDLLMIMAFCFPALPAVALGVGLWRRRLPLGDGCGLWYAVAAGAAFCYCLFIWNKAPLDEDWDLMGPSLMILWMAAGYFLMRAAPNRRRVQIVLCAIVLQLAPTAVWIGWNLTSDPEQQPVIETLREALETHRQKADTD